MSKQTVLVAPLHWGLGHASRCIAIIEEQLVSGNQVIIAASGGPKSLLQSRFPSLEFVTIPFMTITYPKDGNMVRHFFFRGLKLMYSIWREHQLLRALIKEKKIDLVISDSRFGLWNKSVTSVFITHQLEIKSPLLQGSINILNRWVMNQFDEVWIPDFEDYPGLAGNLSHPAKMPKRFKYIGPKSRFKTVLNGTVSKDQTLIMISGPEPQRSVFEDQMIKRFAQSENPVVILQGQPEFNQKKTIGNISVISHLNDDDLIAELEKSNQVISRSGYSSIMDFHVLGVRAEYTATPGQTEQEYLMNLHSK